MSDMAKLRLMTENLPSFPRAVEESDGFKEHHMPCGTSFSWSLLNNPHVSCAKWFSSAGTAFPEHAHEQREFIIPYSGSVNLTNDGKEMRLLPGMWAVIQPNTVHKARFLEDTYYLAITVPQCADWPG